MRTATIAVAAPLAAARVVGFLRGAKDRIGAADRDPRPVRIARGSGVCRLGPEFGTLSGVRNLVRRDSGGAGRPCTCR